jgi:hypothetical protein
MHDRARCVPSSIELAHGTARRSLASPVRWQVKPLLAASDEQGPGEHQPDHQSPESSNDHEANTDQPVTATDLQADSEPRAMPIVTSGNARCDVTVRSPTDMRRQFIAACSQPTN